MFRFERRLGLVRYRSSARMMDAVLPFPRTNFRRQSISGILWTSSLTHPIQLDVRRHSTFHARHELLLDLLDPCYSSFVLDIKILGDVALVLVHLSQNNFLPRLPDPHLLLEGLLELV